MKTTSYNQPVRASALLRDRSRFLRLPGMFSFVGGYPCCCDEVGSTSTSSVPPDLSSSETSSSPPPVVANCCDACEGPQQVQVDLSGIADDGCGSCAALNTSYVLSLSDVGTLSGITQWDVTFDEICSFDSITVAQYCVGTAPTHSLCNQARLEVILRASGTFPVRRIIYSLTPTNSTPCVDWNLLSVPWLTDLVADGYCAGSGSTAKVTAL